MKYKKSWKLSEDINAMQALYQFKMLSVKEAGEILK